MNQDESRKFAAAFGAAIAVLGGVVLVGFLAAFVVRMAWNGSVAEIFGWREIGYWQAYCLYLLGVLLNRPRFAKAAEA